MADTDQRELRQLVDRFVRENKDRESTLQQIANGIGAPEATALGVALAAVVRCPFGSCQSFDTAITERRERGFEVHHCNTCNRNIHVQREENGYSILGWYGE